MVLFDSLFFRHIDHDKTMMLHKQYKELLDKEMFWYSSILNWNRTLNWNFPRAYKPLRRHHAPMEKKNRCISLKLGSFLRKYLHRRIMVIWSATKPHKSFGFVCCFPSIENICKWPHSHIYNIKVFSDRATAVLVFSHMGTTHSGACNNLCKTNLAICLYSALNETQI